MASPEKKADFWQELGVAPPSEGSLVVSLFAYENPAIAELLRFWAQGNTSVCCLAPMTRTLPIIESFVGQSLHSGDVIHSGSLEIRMLPFVEQANYDRLLWSCDINFVRGEDSFVRAQWAEKPMVWQIYPQNDDAHRVKLEAFLDLYCSTLSKSAASAVRGLFMAWNGVNGPHRICPDLWIQWTETHPEIRQHALNWANSLKKQEDLCSSLVRFCRSKL